jgi:phage terminase large subunit-like protein
MVMSRRASGDPCGRALASNLTIPEINKWHEIRMPALSEQGEALWPEYKSAEWLRAIRDEKIALGQDWIWHALYQQQPEQDPNLCAFPSDWLEALEYDELPESVKNRKDVIWDCVSIDPSQGRHDDQGDYTAMWHVLLDCNGQYWCDASIIKRIPAAEIPEVATKFIQLVQPRSVSIETNGDQVIVHEYLVREVAKSDVRAVPVYGHETKVRKEEKIRHTLGPILKNRRIKFRRGSFGTMLTIQQLRDFPSAKYDDGADAVTMAVRHIDERLRQLRRR